MADEDHPQANEVQPDVSPPVADDVAVNSGPDVVIAAPRDITKDDGMYLRMGRFHGSTHAVLSRRIRVLHALLVVLAVLLLLHLIRP